MRLCEGCGKEWPEQDFTEALSSAGPVERCPTCCFSMTVWPVLDVGTPAVDVMDDWALPEEVSGES